MVTKSCEWNSQLHSKNKSIPQVLLEILRSVESPDYSTPGCLVKRAANLAQLKKYSKYNKWSEL
jgi:hypothetical protein